MASPPTTNSTPSGDEDTSGQRATRLDDRDESAQAEVVTRNPTQSRSTVDRAAIRTQDLTKAFGEQYAVNKVNLTVPEGSVFGFLGPNGSGKTTTIRMLLGLVSPTSGGATVLGSPITGALTKALPHVGAMVEGPAFHPYLSGYDNLMRLDAADRHAPVSSARQRVMTALDRVGLGAAVSKKFRVYSLGMKQRLGLAAAIMRPRELLILDEPTNGLDPQGTREVRNLIAEVASDGVTVLVSSHLLSEVEQMCSHIAVMRSGELIEQGSLKELRGQLANRIRVRTPHVATTRYAMRRLGLTDVTEGRYWAEGACDDPSVVPQLVRALVERRVEVQSVEPIQESLEDVFIKLTGEGFDVSG